MGKVTIGGFRVNINKLTTFAELVSKISEMTTDFDKVEIDNEGDRDYGIELIFEYKRDETDKEIERRVKGERAWKLRQIEIAEEKEKAEYERLKAKFEPK